MKRGSRRRGSQLGIRRGFPVVGEPAGPVAHAMSSIDRVLPLLGYKLDRKLGDFYARFCEDRWPANTGTSSWSPNTRVLDSLRRRKFGRLVCKPDMQGALVMHSRLSC
ncbi:hypothetical protein IscW_ISCW020097 [Ixodes scapularis]|uniref:Uncharacterized protein n=1 Tax=Ixodes scapularis TaxID=6945 RepID=B7PZI1_IXOSC|nr:hypothetical protein IscW_ISCW020097 [Ixodes scapularis]|eukprot:XP_002405283.1 hypothetical protein IscW_ISCW020097 [Ixodes scapularis]